MGSGTSNGGRPGLQRAGSSASMTERTFRSPSPNSSGVRQADTDAPPVPPLPKKPRKRATSLETHPLPQRMMSPEPSKPGGRGVSLDRGVPMPASRLAARRAVNLPSVQEIERTDSRNSINFSRPRPASPTAQKPASPTSSLSPRDVTRINGAVSNVANQPVKKKKKKVIPKQPPSDSSGTANGALTAATEAAKTTTEASASPPKKKKKKKKIPPPESIDRDSMVRQEQDQASDSDRPASPRSSKQRAAGVLAKQPSIVREDPEGEEEEKGQNFNERSVNRDDALRRLENGGASDDILTSPTLATAKKHKVKSSSIDLKPPEADQNGDVNELKDRPKSLSPSRAARFPLNPASTTSDAEKHEPPPRSLSPAKSALKYSPSSRDTSPAGAMFGTNIQHGRTASEASDTNTMLSEDTALAQAAAKRKKNVRVSFEADAVVLGQAGTPPTSPDTPVVMSPQHKDPSKRTWLNYGRMKKRDVSPATGSAEDEEEDLSNLMKSRPALPSFGSVRARKEKDDVDDAAREKPLTSGQDAQATSVFTSSTGDLIEMSNDDAIGGMISKDMADKAASSNKAPSDGPLPPLVTSVEGSGYHSESSSNDDQGEDREHQVPKIALLEATPVSEQKEWLGTSSGHQSTDHSSTPVSNKDPVPSPAAPQISSIVGHQPTDPTPATVGIAEPEPAEAAAYHDPASPTVGEVASNLRAQAETTEEEETSEEASSEVYSDAAEDLSDQEGDGFGSINAIVESPAADSVPGLAITTPPDSPSVPYSRSKRASVGKAAKAKSDPAEPSMDEGWNKAQQYWSGLSEQRKQEMEQAALSGADDEGPGPDISKPKTRKKKIVPKKPTPIQTGAERSVDPSDSSLPLPPWPDKTYKKTAMANRTSQGTAPKTARARPGGTAAKQDKPMKKSMRTRQEEPVEVESRAGKPLKSGTMRTSMRTSMRGVPSDVERPPPSRPARTRSVPPETLSTPYEMPLSAATARHLRNMSSNTSTKPAAAPAAAPANGPKKRGKKAGLGRALSNDDDSDASASSFKKQRAKKSASGGFNRKTMRGPPQPDPSNFSQRPGSPDSITAGPAKSSRFSIRSLSPSGSAFKRPFQSASPPPSAPSQGLRYSMRASSESGNHSVRGSTDERPRSAGRFAGFGKSKSKAPPVPAMAPHVAAKAPLKSRIIDSSDEEDSLPQLTHSRYEDSSDDDEGTVSKLTPVRGIPRRAGHDDGDSTDLDDTSADEATKTANALPVTASSKGKTREGAALAAGSLRRSGSGRDTIGMNASKAGAEKRSPDKKKRSIFGALGRRREKSKIQKSELDSAARRDTPLERSKQEVKAAREPTSPGSLGSPPGSPRLQKRLVPSRFSSYNSATWPLAAPAVGEDAPRPNTSDGPVVAPSLTPRPDIGTRRATSDMPAEGRTLVDNGSSLTMDGTTGSKKKKFPFLRKVLRIHD